MSAYVINPCMKIRVSRSGERIEQLHIESPVPGRGLQKIHFERQADARQLESMVMLLNRLRRGGLDTDDEAGARRILIDAGVLVASEKVPARVPFEVVLPVAESRALTADQLGIRLRDHVAVAEAGSAPVDCSSGLWQLMGQDELVWVRGMTTGAWLPYRAPEDVRCSLKAALASDANLGSLPRDSAWRLLDPLCVTSDSFERISVARVRYTKSKHCLLSNVLPQCFRVALADYYWCLVDEGFLPFDDGQSARFWAYNEPVAELVLRELAGFFSSVAEEPLKPTYAYSCSYVPGARLEVHTDRPQCEHSASLLIDTMAAAPDTESWPLGVVEQGSSTIVKYAQQPGDAVLFQGTKVPHFRGIQPEGRRTNCLLLHYVPSHFEGPLG